MHAKFKWLAQNQQKKTLVKAGIETSKDPMFRYLMKTFI